MANDNVLENDLGLVSDDTLREGLIGKDSQQQDEAYLKQISDKLTNVIDQSSEIGALTGRMTLAEGDIATLKSTVNNSESGVGALNTKVETNTTDISEIDERVTTNETDIDSLKSSVSSLSTKVDNNTDGINSLSQRVSTNENDIDSLESRVDTLETSVETNTTDINDLKGRTSTLESGVSSLEESIEDIGHDVYNLIQDKQHKFTVEEPLEYDDENNVLSLSRTPTFEQYHTHSADDVYVEDSVYGGNVISTLGNLNHEFKNAVKYDEVLKAKCEELGITLDVPDNIINLNIIDDNFSHPSQEGTYALFTMNMKFRYIRSRICPNNSWYDIKYGPVYRSSYGDDSQTYIEDGHEVKFKVNNDVLSPGNTSYYDFIHLIDNEKEISGEVAKKIIEDYGDTISVITKQVVNSDGSLISDNTVPDFNKVTDSEVMIAVCFRTDTRVPSGTTFEEYLLGNNVLIDFTQIVDRDAITTPLMNYLEDDFRIDSNNVYVSVTKGGSLVTDLENLPNQLYNASDTNPEVMEELERGGIDINDPYSIVSYLDDYSGVIQIDGVKYLKLAIGIPEIAMKERFYPTTDNVYYGYDVSSGTSIGLENYQIKVTNKLGQELSEIELTQESTIEDVNEITQEIMTLSSSSTQEELNKVLNKYITSILDYDGFLGYLILLVTEIEQLPDYSISYDELTLSFPAIQSSYKVEYAKTINDYFARKLVVDNLKEKVDSLGTVDSAMSDSSTNAVQNKVIKSYVDQNSGSTLILQGTFSNGVVTVSGAQDLVDAFLQGKRIIIESSFLHDNATIEVAYTVLEAGQSIGENTHYNFATICLPNFSSSAAKLVHADINALQTDVFVFDLT